MWKVAAVALLALGAAACGSATTTGTTTAPATTPTPVPVPVPPGWHSYRFARATISVPPGWVVDTDHGCGDPSATGVLALGDPTSLADCPVDADSVEVSALTPAEERAVSLCPTITVNGLAASILPCHNGTPTDIVEYLVPALGVEAVGSGTPGADVSGSGTQTVVGQVLHTLR
jgi:hypothetical protein